MTEIIDLSDIETLKLDLSNGNPIRICQYIESLLADPVALGADPNLVKLFEAFDYWDVALGQTNLDLEQIYAIPINTLMLIAGSEEGFEALKDNPNIGDIIFHYDQMIGAVSSGTMEVEVANEGRINHLAAVSF